MTAAMSVHVGQCDEVILVCQPLLQAGGQVDRQLGSVHVGCRSWTRWSRSWHRCWFHLIKELDNFNPLKKRGEFNNTRILKMIMETNQLLTISVVHNQVSLRYKIKNWIESTLLCFVYLLLWPRLLTVPSGVKIPENKNINMKSRKPNYPAISSSKPISTLLDGDSTEAVTWSRRAAVTGLE